LNDDTFKNMLIVDSEWCFHIEPCTREPLCSKLKRKDKPTFHLGKSVQWVLKITNQE